MQQDHRGTIYRGRRIPNWWADYLPDEKNPYREEDTLTLEVGCLSDYWHIHSSNKHPNYNGAKACNYVREMVKERFGGAFVSFAIGVGRYGSGGRQGEVMFHEPEHIVYENAYIGEDEKIHITNAKKYYEDVIRFVQDVLRAVAKNHLQSGMDYEAREFFPYKTDAQMEELKRRRAI